jgi:hypothetical protein
MKIYPIKTEYGWFLKNLPSFKKNSERVVDKIAVFEGYVYATSGRALLCMPAATIPDGVYTWSEHGLVPELTMGITETTKRKLSSIVEKYNDVLGKTRTNCVSVCGSLGIATGIACYLTAQGITLDWIRHDGDLIRRFAKIDSSIIIHCGGDPSSVLFVATNNVRLVIMSINPTVFSYKEVSNNV